MDDVRSLIAELEDSIKEVIVGNEDVIDRMIDMLIVGGHALSEDEPGVGKTLLAESMARATGMDFSWVQGTPDLRPSDLTGISVFNPETRQWNFHEGPVFTNTMVYDEINRASPRTQSGILEAMQNGKVTVDGKTYDLPTPFLVLATQNPLEHEGVYPLPAAQIDRFPIRLTMQELSVEEETLVYERTELGTPQAKSVPGFDIHRIRKEYEIVHVNPRFRRYVAQLMAAARNPSEHGLPADAHLGRTTRPGEWLIRMAKAGALREGSRYIKADHITPRVFAVLNHRLRMGFGGPASGDMLELLRKEFVPALIEAVPVPGVSEDQLEKEADEARNN